MRHIEQDSLFMAIPDGLVPPLDLRTLYAQNDTFGCVIREISTIEDVHEPLTLSIDDAYQIAAKADRVYTDRNQSVNEATGVVGLAGGFVTMGPVGLIVGPVVSFVLKHWILGDMRPFGPTAVQIIQHIEQNPDSNEEDALCTLLKNEMRKHNLEHRFPSKRCINRYAQRRSISCSLATRELVRIQIARRKG
jgi:hypothetical protein